MTNVPANVFVIESSILYNMDNDLLLELLNSLKDYDVFKSEEVGYTLVKTSSNIRLYLSIGINSLFIYGNKGLHDLLEQYGIKYYINLKNIWIKTCRLCKSVLIGDFLRKLFNQLKTIDQGECIYIDSSYNIYTSLSNDIKLQICYNIVDNVDVVSLKPNHPISYGVLNHIDIFDKKYLGALKRYLNEKTNYDTLAYVVIDENYRSFIDVYEVKRFVRINFIPKGIDLFKLLLNSVLYILCI